MSPPHFKNFFLWKKKRQIGIKLKYIIKQVDVNRLCKEHVFSGYRIVLFSINLMWIHMCNVKFSSSHIKKVKGEINFNDMYLSKYI